MEVEIVVDYEGCRVHTSMAMDGDYPRMEVDDVRA
jgi:hypothetical protein